MKQSYSHRERNTQNSREIGFVLVVTLLIAAYVFARYGKYWSVGGDTYTFTTKIRAMFESGMLIPKNRYPNGYGFQTLGTFLMNMSGIRLENLQVIPLIGNLVKMNLTELQVKSIR